MSEVGEPVWSAQAGEYNLPVRAFLDEVRDFDARFTAAMGERVATARANWPQPGVYIDLDQLAREREEQSQWLARSEETVARHRGEDWEAILDALAAVDRANTR